ncbi:ubiquinone biosynthesis protein COQ4 homolog, mitochondrial-like [Penaeus japonicus]|uniref:ubiquinone biosynthesis protein COQ4 homolog, mitochondrial-like n=1 Tax=Penaeus japonicus TaxID=27405 RepID=UPI001C716C2E|nr:ubiquinone biosynthesis protein COQ4 homolog, mitochondrial-like [Penaeus japonicus]
MTMLRRGALNRRWRHELIRNLAGRLSHNYARGTHTQADSSETREIPIKRSREKTDDGSESQQEIKEEKAVPLYKHHIPTDIFQKSLLTVGAAAAALLNPRRHDMVAVLGETTGHMALSRIYALMIEDEEGQQILKDKPRINSSTLDLPYLRKLPEGTLGHAYMKFLDDNEVTPDSRLPVQFVDDAELAYVMQRYREGHDLFHTVLGMPTNMLGEVAVKWIEGIQTGLPMCVGGAIFGPLRFRPKQRQKYISEFLPWAIRVGRSSKLLMNVYFEKRWEQPLSELRDELGIESPPFL